jgi:molecular chaperone GrpE (heat shock protein)
VAKPHRQGVPPSHASALGHTGGPSATHPQLEAILAGLGELKGMLEPLVARPGEPDAALEIAVDSLRRFLSELLERRLESVVQDLVEIRREAAAATEGNRERALARIDRLLRELGVLRFEAEAMAVVDPLIHTVIGGRRDDGVPDGLILEAAQPGFRSARGLVLSKAAVVVNRRA